MKRVLIILCLLVVTVPVVAQTNSEILEFLIQQGGSKSNSVSDLAVMYRFDQACDYDDPVTRGYAMLIAKPSLSNTITIAQICDIFDAIRPPHWTYFPDPYGGSLGDRVVKASESITLGLKGDCDDFAVLVASCIRAIGGACRILLMRADPVGHAYAEVYVGDKASAGRIANYIFGRYRVDTIAVHIDTDGDYWLSLDWGGTPPRWTDAYPGHLPLTDIDKAEKTLTVPVYSIAARAAGTPLPVPDVP
jgi:transglutaminase-like putative cysteine protease